MTRLRVLRRRVKQLVVDARFADAFAPQAARHLGDHRFRSAQEELVERADADQVPVQFAAFAVVDAAVQHVGFLLFAAHHVDPLQPVEVCVLQETQLLAEHHRGGAAIAVQQRHPAARFAREHRADDRQDRRDAAAGGDAQVAARLLRAATAS